MNKKKQTEQYKVVLEMADKKYTQKADTVNEAIGNMGLSWVDIKMKGTIMASKNKKSCEHLFNLRVLKRIFANKTARLLWAKRLTYLLDN